MKRFAGCTTALLLISALLLFSCDEKPSNPVSEYGGGLVDTYKRGQSTGQTANLDVVKHAVQYYQATYGKLPETLDDAKEFIGSEVDLSKFDYNPETGAVSLKK